MRAERACPLAFSTASPKNFNVRSRKAFPPTIARACTRAALAPALILGRVVPKADDRLDPRLDLLGRGHLAGLRRVAGRDVEKNPASPIVSGKAPRLLASTGMPLSIASAATSPNDSFQSEGTTNNLVSA